MTNEISLESIAFRSVYEQRACPPDELLFASDRSEEMVTHLGYCRYCNERLALTSEDQSAWHQLVERLKPITGSVKNPDNPPASGQIWSLDNKLSNWGPYARYYTPPLVFVLHSQDKEQTFRVAQTCAEYVLMGDDGADIKLGEDMGFVETWNVFSVHRDDLKVCRGIVGKSIAQQVLMQANNQPVQAKLPPVIYKFRELEAQVGAFIAMQTLSHVMAVVEAPALQPVTVNGWLEQLFGKLSEVKSHVAETVSGWNLPELSGSVFDFLTGASLELAPGQAAGKTNVENINLVSAEEKGLLVGSLSATIISDYLEDEESFFIRGKLTENAPETLTLLARLTYEQIEIDAEVKPIPAGSKAFSITFKNVPIEACNMKNVRILLVKP